MITPNIQVTINLQKIDKDKPKDVRTHIKLSRRWKWQLYISWVDNNFYA